jgi:putative tryptophan/tyrosine transport system substrate-binding protein
MKTIKSILFITIVFLITNCNREKEILITVNQFVHHPNLEKTYKGVTDVVNEWAKKNNKKVKFDLQVANNDVSLASQIAKQQSLKEPNIMLALATPSAQACQKVSNKIPIVFGAVTDPIVAELVNSIENPGGNITGTSDLWPYDKQFAFLKEILPNTKKIGVILNSSESNTEASMKIIKNIVKKYNFEIIESPVTSTSEIFTAANSLVGKCDVFFAPADNTVLSGLEAFVKVARTNNIPLFVGDEGSVEKGGIATYGIDYYQLGRETGNLIIQVLEGKNISTIPVVVGSDSKLIINKEAMQYFKINIPDKYLKESIMK